MADPSPPPSAAPSGGFGFRIPDPAATLSALPAPVPYVLAAALAVLFLFSFQASPKLPHLNPRKALEFSESRRKQEFVVKSRAMLDAWFREHPDQATRVIGDSGEIIVLPPNLANEMRNDPRLSFADWIRKVGVLVTFALKMCTRVANDEILNHRTSMLTSPALRAFVRVPVTPELSRKSS